MEKEQNIPENNSEEKQPGLKEGIIIKTTEEGQLVILIIPD